MTDNLEAFLDANKRSGVVYGEAIGNGGEGAVYSLEDGQTFTLTRDECEQMKVPRWIFHNAPDEHHKCEQCGIVYAEGAHFYDDTCNPCARKQGMEVPKP